MALLEWTASYITFRIVVIIIIIAFFSRFLFFFYQQHALRLHAFRQLHKVLGIEPLKPPPRRGRGRGKRRRDESVGSKNGAKVQKKEEEKPEAKTEEASK